MGMCGEGTQTTTQESKYQPSPTEQSMLDQKNKILTILFNYLIKPGIKGMPTGQQLWGTNLASQNLKEMAGKMGVQPGDPRLIQSFQQIQESLTKPDQDIAKLAMSLYGGIPFIQTGSTTGTATQGYNPGMLDYMSLIPSAFGAAGMMGWQPFGKK